MANEQHLEAVKKGRESWQQWRRDNQAVRPDLSGVDLREVELRGFELSNIDFRGSNLAGVDLSGTNVMGCDFTGADIKGIGLAGILLSGSILVGANLSYKGFHRTRIGGADLTGANFSNCAFMDADFGGSNMTNVNFTNAKIGNQYHFSFPKQLAGADFTNMDLSGVDFSGADLVGAIFDNTRLISTNFVGANLSGVRFRGARAIGANFKGATLIGADFSGTAYGIDSIDSGGRDPNDTGLYGPARYYTDIHAPVANLFNANFSEAILTDVNFSGVNLNKATLHSADLTGANLRYASLVETNIEDATINDCLIYGISAWKVNGTPRRQTGLVITSKDESEITVDDLQLAQFLHLLLNNANIRSAINAITSKVVLILGRFTPERIEVLRALRDELRRQGFLPVLFDFEGPSSRDVTETISTLAHLAKFVIADITDAKSIPQELTAIVPHLPSVPIQPLLLNAQQEYGMFEHFRRYPWVLPVHNYETAEDLIASLPEKVIKPSVDWLDAQNNQ